MMLRKSKGRELAEDLAQYLQTDRWMTWVEIALGPMDTGVAKADVLAVFKSYAPRFLIYEVKTSRADFMRDVNSGKHTKYFDHCTQFYFACPAGIIKKEEIPLGCGLITKGDHGWHTVKAARRNDFKPSRDFLLKLLMKGYEDHSIQVRQLDRERLTKNAHLKAIAQSLGIKIAHDLAKADEVIAAADKLRKELADLLGKDFESLYSAAYALQSEIQRMIRQREFLREAVELSVQIEKLWDGSWWSADAVPRHIRQIADGIEAKVKDMKEEEEQRRSGKHD